MVLSRLVAAGKLERAARGVYSLPGRPLSEHRSLAEAALRVVRMSGAALTEGIEPIEIDGVKVPVFNAAVATQISQIRFLAARMPAGLMLSSLTPSDSQCGISAGSAAASPQMPTQMPACAAARHVHSTARSTAG